MRGLQRIWCGADLWGCEQGEIPWPHHRLLQKFPSKLAQKKIWKNYRNREKDWTFGGFGFGFGFRGALGSELRSEVASNGEGQGEAQLEEKRLGVSLASSNKEAILHWQALSSKYTQKNKILKNCREKKKKKRVLLNLRRHRKMMTWAKEQGGGREKERDREEREFFFFLIKFCSFFC